MIVEMLAGLALQQACLSDGQQITGELRYVETSVPVDYLPEGAGLRAAFIVLPETACLEVEGGQVEGRWIQLFYDNRLMFTDIPRGSRIVIEASHYALPTTPWHIGDFVAFEIRVVDYGPRLPE